MKIASGFNTCSTRAEMRSRSPKAEDKQVSLPELAWLKMVAMRHRLVHTYYDIWISGNAQLRNADDLYAGAFEHFTGDTVTVTGGTTRLQVSTPRTDDLCDLQRILRAIHVKHRHVLSSFRRDNAKPLIKNLRSRTV